MSLFFKITVLCCLVVSACVTPLQARYNANVKRVYKPKTDSVSYQDRAKKFRRGLTLSKAGDYIAYLGTGLALTGAVLNDRKILMGGAGTLAIGLPVIGFGSMYMRSSILSEATMKPNGFPWYITSLIMAGSFIYATEKYTIPKTMVYGGGIIISSTTLASWIKFTGFRNLMARRYSEYTFTLTPVINLTASQHKSLGLLSKLHF